MYFFFRFSLLMLYRSREVKMINDIINAVFDALKDIPGFNQKEFYEGQFEDLKNFIINPPALFLEAPQGSMLRKDHDTFKQDIRIYVVTSKMIGIDDNAMYLRLDELRKLMHDRSIKTTSGQMIYTYVDTWNKLGIFPGFCVYEMMINVEA